MHPGRNVQVNLRRRDLLMPMKVLDRPQIRPVFEQMRRERVPQRMTRHVLLDPRRRCRPLDRLVLNLPVQMMPPTDPGLRLRPDRHPGDRSIADGIVIPARPVIAPRLRIH